MKFEGRDRQDTSRYLSSTIYTKLDELTLVDIRDSGQIEEGADLILMLCGDEYYQNTSNQGIMAIIEDL